MKHTPRFRLLSLLLVLVLMMQVTILAAPDVPVAEPTADDAAMVEPSDSVSDAEEAVEPDIDEVSDDKVTPEELGITIPDGWSHNALYFAVVHGILVGSNGGDLQAEAPTTRAQMATILTRMIGAADTKGHTAVAGESLDAYTDVEHCWYTPYLSVAVRLGIFNGVTSTTLAPNSNITREQAFTVIGRTFGLQNGSKEDCSSYNDAGDVSSYAARYVGALVKNGYVNGDNHNNLNPKAAISRQELAQVLYNMFSRKGTICESASDLPESGMVLYTGTDAIPAGTHIQGNLILCVDTPAELTLENVTIDGTLAVVMKDDSKLTCTGCSADSVTLLSKTDVSFDTKVNNLSITGADGAAYTGDAETVTISANSTILGTYGTVTVSAANVTAASGSALGALTLNREGGTFCLDGTAKSVVINPKNVTLSGSGRAEEVLVHGKGYSITCAAGTVKEDLDLGLSGTTITMSKGHTVSSSNPTVKVTATFSGVNAGNGSVNGYRVGTLYWYVDGTLKQSVNVSVRDNSAASFSHTFTFYQGMSSSATVKAVFIHNDEEISASTQVAIDKSVYIPQVNGSISGGDYTTYQKETFVNAKGYSSSSSYLVWINLYKTKVNVFTGYSGNWKLLKTYDCGIGAVNTPTPPGLYRMQTHIAGEIWYYGSGADRWYVDKISRWNGGYAFHSRRKSAYTHQYQVNDLNVMISHGCIRMNTEEAAWLYNVPIGSTVVVY